MAVSKAQQARVNTVCKCCGEAFSAFPIYRKGGGGLRVPDYKRGHHPNCRRTQIGKTKPWNKGLSAKDVAAIGRQGKHGADHWRYDPDQNPDWFAKDFDYVLFSERYGKKPRSKGGNKAYAKFRLAIMGRDKFACQDCGMLADDAEETDLLQVHHIVYVKHDKTRIFDPANVITLCFNCHWKIHRRKKVAAP